MYAYQSSVINTFHNTALILIIAQLVQFVTCKYCVKTTNH